jgi:hypothetical protein
MCGRRRRCRVLLVIGRVAALEAARTRLAQLARLLLQEEVHARCDLEAATNLNGETGGDEVSGCSTQCGEGRIAALHGRTAEGDAE